MRKNSRVTQLLLLGILLFFGSFLIVPLLVLSAGSWQSGWQTGLAQYGAVLSDKNIMLAIRNSLKISAAAALLTTGLAFGLAYTVHCTNIPGKLKKAIHLGIILPMLLPTITYGFAIIYSFGKQGLLTKLFGYELLSIYGFNGLLTGYVIYTLPPAFLLINNAFSYVDKKFIIVSQLMGDSFWRSFVNTVLRPLLGTIGSAFVLAFILCFTDFGIPASLGGTYNVIATELYQVMLGTIPDFQTGSVIALLMLVPAVFAVLFLNHLEKFNFHYEGFRSTALPVNKLRDRVCGILSLALVGVVAAVFAVMFVAPAVKNYPYDMSFTLQFIEKALASRMLLEVYENSLLVALASAAAGTILSYSAAVVNVRTGFSKQTKASLDLLAMIANTVPGMVLGLAYLLSFNGSSLKGTFTLIICCNIIHFFTTPYLMAKNSLAKLNPAWETTGELMGDTWAQTMVRVIIPNSLATIVEMFSYYFINAMVTISAIIFLVTAKTAVVTSKIKELQHFASFNEIFVLSILILMTNVAVKLLSDFWYQKLATR
jgi:iron(III) transport system permease protein